MNKLELNVSSMPCGQFFFLDHYINISGLVATSHISVFIHVNEEILVNYSLSYRVPLLAIPLYYTIACKQTSPQPLLKSF